MSPDRWNRIKDLLDVALRLEPGEREAGLTRLCAGDSELRAEVESLIAAYQQAGGLFDTPVVQPGEDPLIGAVIDHYRVVERIGSGGMGAVYRALRADDVFEKEVAFKIVRRGLDPDPMVRQFRRERQILASLDHPNIAGLMDGGATPEGLPYFVMEFVRGKPIDLYCEEHRLPIPERLRLFETVCAAVDFAHKQGVIHRDIKPGNILVTSDGIPKLLDFGIAKRLAPEIPGRSRTTTLVPALTPAYASPEQLRGETATEVSDVYSLGVLLYELLTGKRPDPQKNSAWGTGEAGATQPPSRLVPGREISGDLDNIVLKAIREEPGKRYSSAALLREDVERYLMGLPVMARKGSLLYRLAKLARRRKAPLIAAAAMAVLMAAVFVLAGRWVGGPESRAPTRITHLTSLPGREFQPAFSPDGQRVAYVWSGENGENADIYIQAASGGQARRLTTGKAEDLSPVWSPDGSRIAWLRLRPGEHGIFVSPEGGGVHGKIAGVFPTLVETVGRHLDWSPDGRFLAAADKNTAEQPFRIVLISLRDGAKRDLTMPPDKAVGDMCPAFSPNGKSIAFIRGLSSGVADIYTAPLGGGPVRRITHDNRLIQGLAWTPGGASIVFSSERRGNPSLWSVPVSGGEPARLPLIGDNAIDPAFSRDGRRMAYTEFLNDGNIWRIAAGGQGAPQKVVASTLYDSSPQYSPDGSRIAFRSNRSGASEIWVSDRNGRAPAQLTRFGGPITGTPRWSPDGQQIAFDSRPEGHADIYAVAAEGGPVRRVTGAGQENVVPSWSRDGKWIYFASNRSGTFQVWRVPAAGGVEEPVTKLGGFAAFESPDGRYLFYAKGRGVPGLWRKLLPGGKEEPVLEELKAGYWGCWAAVPGGVYFLDRPAPNGPAGIFFYSLSSRLVQRLFTMEQLPPVGDAALAVSPDGRYLLYTQIDQSGSDILLAEGYFSRK